MSTETQRLREDMHSSVPCHLLHANTHLQDCYKRAQKTAKSHREIQSHLLYTTLSRQLAYRLSKKNLLLPIPCQEINS